jgi:hypothetical protein
MKTSDALRWLVPTTLFVGIVTFVMMSHPMVRPGFDVWWHLGAVDAPDRLDSSAFPTRRILWHHFWHRVFSLLQVHDHFARALVIHRTQFLVTVFALALTGYLLLRVLIRKKSVVDGSLWTAALLSAVFWLATNGTRSVAHGGGPGADVAQSWLLWYSVNYQISLPLVLLSMALLLSAVDQERSTQARWGFVIGFFAALSVATLVHVAEVVYFLLFAVLVAALYLRGRYAVVLAIALSVGGLLLAGLALNQAYAVPRLMAFVLKGDLFGALDAIQQEGELLRSTGLTRIDTGWHVLHTVSLVGLVLGILVWRNRGTPSQQGWQGKWKASVAVVLTAVFPLALMTNLGAGLFAFLTHTYIAWRFSLASLLFIGVPFAALALSERLLSHTGVIWRQLATVGVVIAVCGLAVWGENDPERPSPSLAFGQSLARSLHPEEMYFGLNLTQQSALRALSDSLKAPPAHSVLCADIFTSYYLFFLERYRWVSLPPALEYMPGYQKSETDCGYPADNPTLRGMGLDGVPPESRH